MEHVKCLPPADLAETAAWHCRVAGLPEPVREYRFHPSRRWRFDLAWPDQRVAVEVHGGEFMRGHHTRGREMANDCEKARAAAIAGWIVLPYTGRQVREAPAAMAREIGMMLKARELAACRALPSTRIIAEEKDGNV